MNFTDKLYLLIDPTQPTFDKVMTFNAAYLFAMDIALQEDKEVLEDLISNTSLTKEGKPYKEDFMIRVLEGVGYQVQVFDNGTVSLEGYISDLKDMGREIG